MSAISDFIGSIYNKKELKQTNKPIRKVYLIEIESYKRILSAKWNIYDPD